MSRTRLLNKPKEGPKRGVLSPTGWDGLILKAIRLAEIQEDRRLEGLRRASEEGRSELFLRKLGIICDADLAREFPGPKA